MCGHLVKGRPVQYVWCHALGYHLAGGCLLRALRYSVASPSVHLSSTLHTAVILCNTYGVMPLVTISLRTACCGHSAILWHHHLPSALHTSVTLCNWCSVMPLASRWGLPAARRRLHWLEYMAMRSTKTAGTRRTKTVTNVPTQSRDLSRWDGDRGAVDE